MKPWPNVPSKPTVKLLCPKCRDFFAEGVGAAQELALEFKCRCRRYLLLTGYDATTGEYTIHVRDG